MKRSLRCRHTGVRCLAATVVALFLIIPRNAIAQTGPERIAIVRLLAPGAAQLEAIARLGIEPYGTPLDRDVVVYVDEGELQALRTLGVTLKIVEEDAARFFASRLDASLGPGSMGGYYTLAEVETRLDQLAAAYPQIISPKFAVGTSLEGRTIWGFRMSDQPGTTEATRPAVYFNSLIHAREPMSMMQLIGFVEELARKWAEGDRNARYLLASRELWFVPVINPDGYYYNETQRPEGGHMWRKNKRDNDGNGIFEESQDGVDLNRNFQFHWGEDDLGSSPNPRAPTYRGTAPLSEPETRAVLEVFRMREPGTFQFVLDYHAHGNVYIYPWGYTPAEVDRIDDFRAWAARMSKFNHFFYGTGDETIGYGTNGDAADHQYGVEGVLAMVPEVGSAWDAFWPPTTRIPVLLSEQLWPNYITAWMAGGVLIPEQVTADDPTGNQNGYPDPGETVEVRITWSNAGFGGAVTNARATLSALGNDATVVQGSVWLGDFASGERRTAVDPFLVRVEAVPSGRRMLLEVRVEGGAGYTRVDTIGVFIGRPEVLVQQDWESGTQGWGAFGGFGRSGRYAYSGTYSITDAPFGGVTNAVNWLDLLQPVSLAGYDGAVLRFRSRKKIGPRNIALVTLGPAPDPWPSAELPRTTGDPLVYYSTGDRDGWEEVEIDLTPFAGTPDLYLRWASLYGSVSGGIEGWSIDDVRLEAWTSTLSKAEPQGRISLGNPFPNPANPVAGGAIFMDLDLRQVPGSLIHVTLEVYDARGRLIGTAFEGTLENQRYVGFLQWDGTDSTGRQVASGIYFLHLRAGRFTATRKVIILR